MSENKPATVDMAERLIALEDRVAELERIVRRLTEER